MGSSVFYSDPKGNRFSYDIQLKIKQNIPNIITGLRLVILPHLVYSFNHQITLVAYALFLLVIGTDLVDGYFARKFGSISNLGAFLDVIVDFIFISGMYLVFIINGTYSSWILVVIILVFTQFILSNLYVKQTIYDPVGKYYGSLLFGGIGLTLLFSNQLIYDIVTYGIAISTIICITSRLSFFFFGRQKK
jgi:phosphatidylglycerophosphate synthase